jgi:hypothetical protein
MGGLGHFEASSTWGIPSSSYIKSSKSHTIAVQMLFMEGHLVDAYHKAIKWFLPPHEPPGFIQKVHLESRHNKMKRLFT